MRVPDHVFSTSAVECLCKRSAQLFLCLDYDDALVPIASRPEDAYPSPALLTLLAQLVETPGIKVAIVSGRTLSDLCHLLPVSGLTYIGTHGLEMRTVSGETRQLVPTGAFTTIMTRLRREFAPVLSTTSGVLLEYKQYALALHYRLAPPEEAEWVVPRFLTLIRAYQKKGFALEVLRGKHVIEVRPIGASKGKAVQSLPEYQEKATAFLYLGHEVTDEEGFQALEGRGLTILVADPPRRTTAHCYLKDPGEVFCLLSRVLSLRRNQG